MSTPPDPNDPSTPSAGDATPRKRRVRYKGTHPKRFEERYKELAGDPDEVAHVLAKGRTPAGQHVPIMVDEILAVLAPEPGMRAVDCTLGFGGHAQRLLERLTPGGTLLGLDADPLQLPRAEARLRKVGYDESTFVAKRSNFAGFLGAIMEQGWHDGVDVVLADLGVSSMQIDDPSRGFTYGADGPLDMRMNPARGVSAAQWLERASLDAIERALRDNADEPRAGDIADLLDERRGQLATTTQLADAVREAWADVRDTNEIDRSVRRVFQALRIEVNDEFGVLDALLRDLPKGLKPGGHVAILSFHSGEDRRVKKAFQAGERSGVYAAVAPDVIRADMTERFDNPRSKPAKLRWARRAG